MRNEKLDKFKTFVKENKLPILAVTSVAAMTTIGVVNTCKYVKLKSLFEESTKAGYWQAPLRGFEKIVSDTDPANGFFTSITNDGIVKTADLSSYVADLSKAEGYEFDDICEILLVGTKKELESNG